MTKQDKYFLEQAKALYRMSGVVKSGYTLEQVQA